jgi:hypothetical protein
MDIKRVVHFVCFETSLDSEAFIEKWKRYTNSLYDYKKATLQKTNTNTHFKYIAQHRCTSSEFQFICTKGAKLTRTREVEIKKRQIGGYTVVYEERSGNTKECETKVFAFLIYPNANLDFCKQLSNRGKLNIYEAYYENCAYAYILEFFVKDENIPILIEQLHQYKVVDVRTYKECILHPA